MNMILKFSKVFIQECLKKYHNSSNHFAIILRMPQAILLS